MRPTPKITAPVITLFSPSQLATNRAQDLLVSLFGLEAATPAKDVTKPMHKQHRCGNTIDVLDEQFRSRIIPGLSRNWKSSALRCPRSGTILHWLALDTPESASYTNNISQSDNGIDRKEISCPFSLLSITDTKTEDCEDNVEDLIAAVRRKIASNLVQQKDSLSSMHVLSLNLRKALGRPITVNTLSGQHGLPLLELPPAQNRHLTKSNQRHSIAGGLKEIAFPMVSDATYPRDRSTVATRFSDSGLHRPVTGLYEWPENQGHQQGLCIRLLPLAKQDMMNKYGPGGGVVLTFQPPIRNLETLWEKYPVSSDDNNLNDDLVGAIQRQKISDAGVQFFKIGYSGRTRGGQVMIRHPDLKGLDVRWCYSEKPSSVFSEAQDSLLASSFDELQSTNSMLQSPEKVGVHDQRMGAADCWVEFRANLKRPSEFFRRNLGSSESSHNRVATAPPSHYQ